MKLVVNNWPEEAQRELAVVGDEPAAAAGEPVAGWHRVRGGGAGRLLQGEESNKDDDAKKVRHGLVTWWSEPRNDRARGRVVWVKLARIAEQELLWKRQDSGPLLSPACRSTWWCAHLNQPISSNDIFSCLIIEQRNLEIYIHGLAEFSSSPAVVKPLRLGEDDCIVRKAVCFEICMCQQMTPSYPWSSSVHFQRLMVSVATCEVRKVCDWFCNVCSSIEPLLKPLV